MVNTILKNLVSLKDIILSMKCNDYSERKYKLGEIPNLEVPTSNNNLLDEDIVYSPTKYRETEGIKGLWR